MIIAKIGDTILKLDDLKTAEALLAIVAKAERLDTTFDEHYDTYYLPACASACLTIEITNAQVLSTEDHQLKLAAREEAQREASEQNATAQASSTI